jgi:hypothetical protein
MKPKSKFAKYLRFLPSAPVLSDFNRRTSAHEEI